MSRVDHPLQLNSVFQNASMRCRFAAQLWLLGQKFFAPNDALRGGV
jgi:hypothetical protein